MPELLKLVSDSEGRVLAVRRLRIGISIGYTDWLTELKTRINSDQQHVALSVNRELILLDWQIGRDILERQAQRLGRKGSRTALARFTHRVSGYERLFPRQLDVYARLCGSLDGTQIVQQLVGRLPWGHNLVLLSKLKGVENCKRYAEREIENALVQHITRFWIELGVGVVFVGWQYHLQVGGDDFFIDLLSYRLKLRCYVAVELKIGAFNPEHAGQLSF